MSITLEDVLQRDVEREAANLTFDDIVEREIDSGILFGPYHRQRVMSTAPERVARHLRMAEKARLAGFVPMMGRQGFASMDVNDFPPASFTAVTASATETNLWTPAIWTPIPANDMRSGKVYKVSFGGVFTSTATQGTLTWTPRAGQSGTPASNVTLGASGAVAPAASITAGPWYGEFTLGIRAIGLAASGATGTGNGLVVTHAGTATGTMYVMGGSVPTTIDNTAASGLIVSLTISVASQSYTCQWTALRSYN